MHKRILAASVVMALLLTTACSVNVGGDRVNFSGNVSFDKGTELKEEQNIARNVADVEKLEISDNAGNVTIKGTTSDDIGIRATKKVKGTNEEMKKEVMQNIDVVVESSGNKLSVYIASRDGKKDDLWNWTERMYKGTQVTVDLELDVPANIKAYDIDVNAGNIAFNDIAGEIGIQNNAGNIEVTGGGLTGTSSIKINAGNILIDSDISKASKLTVVDTAGNVTMKLPAGTGFDLAAKLTAGNLNGSFLSGTRINSGTYKQEINGGGTEVNVTTVAGNVTIDKK